MISARWYDMKRERNQNRHPKIMKKIVVWGDCSTKSSSEKTLDGPSVCILFFRNTNFQQIKLQSYIILPPYKNNNTKKNDNNNNNNSNKNDSKNKSNKNNNNNNKYNNNNNNNNNIKNNYNNDNKILTIKIIKTNKIIITIISITILTVTIMQNCDKFIKIMIYFWYIGFLNSNYPQFSEQLRVACGRTAKASLI